MFHHAKELERVHSGNARALKFSGLTGGHFSGYQIDVRLFKVNRFGRSVGKSDEA